jgi:hypothetical protein
MGDRVVARGPRETRPIDGGACRRRPPSVDLAGVEDDRVGRRRVPRVGGGRHVPGRGRSTAVAGGWRSSWPRTGGRCSSQAGAAAGRVVLFTGGGGGQTALCRQRVFRFESVGVRGSRDGHARGTKCPNFHRPPLADGK